MLVQKAQRDQKRAIDNYNREVRKHNAAVKQAVNKYNREVRNYNSRARTHNRKVESQRRRVQQEIQRLNVVWVRSFVPKEKNWAYSAISSAVRAARGISIIVPNL